MSDRQELRSVKEPLAEPLDELLAGRPIRKSSKLDDVCYDIRGPVLQRAKQLEDEGHRIIKLNIGNPAPFGFEAPEEIVVDVIRNLPRRVRLLRLQGPLLRPQGGDALLPAEADPRRGRRGHLPRQRRLRAHRHGHAGAARPRRRGAGARPGLPALDRGGEPLRRQGPPLPVRRGRRLAAGPRTTSAPGSRPGPGPSSSSTPTTPPARSTRRSCSASCSRSPGATG